jgi:hypothetical protein
MEDFTIFQCGLETTFFTIDALPGRDHDLLILVIIGTITSLAQTERIGTLELFCWMYRRGASARQGPAKVKVMNQAEV